VYPTDRTKHRFYRFYVRVSANGGSNAFFGPYDLHVGCTQGGVVFTDAADFVENVAMYVGGSTYAVYEFKPPSATLSYCGVKTNTIVDENYSPTDKLKMSEYNCTSGFTNCTWFDLASSDLPEYLMFRVMTTFDGDLIHYSPLASISIAAVFTMTQRDPEADVVD
jgi:hypothetical protein